MKYLIIYLICLSIILVFNYNASKLNEKYDEETPNKD